jgi:hypothetical protein
VVVAADRSSLSGLSLSVDLNCSEVPVTLSDLPFDFGSQAFPLQSDGSFAIDLSGGDSSGSIHFVLGGTAGAGQASGSLRVDVVLNTDFGVLHCSTGALTWNAV